MSYQEDRFTEIADVIRGLKGSSSLIKPVNFSKEILDISYTTFICLADASNTISVRVDFINPDGTIRKTFTPVSNEITTYTVRGMGLGSKVKIRNTGSVRLQMHRAQGVGESYYNPLWINSNAEHIVDRYSGMHSSGIIMIKR